MAQDLHLPTAVHVDFATVLAMQTNEGYVAMRLPSGGRCYRVAESVQFSSAQPGPIVYGSVDQPLAYVSASRPYRHHHVERPPNNARGSIGS